MQSNIKKNYEKKDEMYFIKVPQLCIMNWVSDMKFKEKW